MQSKRNSTRLTLAWRRDSKQCSLRTLATINCCNYGRKNAAMASGSVMIVSHKSLLVVLLVRKVSLSLFLVWIVFMRNVQWCFAQISSMYLGFKGFGNARTVRNLFEAAMSDAKLRFLKSVCLAMLLLLSLLLLLCYRFRCL